MLCSTLALISSRWLLSLKFLTLLHLSEKRRLTWTIQFFLCKLAEHTRTYSFSLFRMGALTHALLSISHSCTRTHSFCLFLPLTLALSPFLSHSFAPTQAYTNTIFCLSSHTNTLAHARTSTHTLAETNVFLICYLKVVPHNDEFLP